MIAGIGVDLVKIIRIKEILERWSDKFTSKLFTDVEINYCSAHKDSYLRYASTFAAKEAFIKAHGRGNLKLKDIEIVREESGRPVVRLYREAKDLMALKNITNINVTMTHDGEYAVAVVVLEKG